MRGYKGMNNDMTCRGMQFEVGKTYRIDGEIEICHNGLHFCQNLVDVFDYYEKSAGSRYFEVETKEDVITLGNKSVTSELTILREIEDIEVNRATYGYGDGYGYGYGDGYGDGYGNGYGDGYGYGYGYGYGNGYGDGYGYGYGYGNGNGYGYGYGKNIQRIGIFKLTEDKKNECMCSA